MNLLYAFYYAIYGYFAIPEFSMFINGFLLAMVIIAVNVVFFTITKTEK